MTVEADAARRYTSSAIETRIDEALRAAGKDPEHFAPDDLIPLDEFHLSGRAATERFVRHLELRSNMRLLDIGFGTDAVVVWSPAFPTVTPAKAGVQGNR
jgi:MPBQ/MSBQ methyltransferase